MVYIYLAIGVVCWLAAWIALIYLIFKLGRERFEWFFLIMFTLVGHLIIVFWLPLALLGICYYVSGIQQSKRKTLYKKKMKRNVND